MKTIEQFVKELNEKFPKQYDWSETFMFTEGKKFFKICRTKDGYTPSSAYGFVDKNTGDLYKAASYSIPAKHVRGNINDESGLNACEQYSVIYLR